MSQLLLDGLRRYEAEDKPRYKETFASLASGQSPHTLVITCADSRVVPTLIASADPGELFVVRNVANIVPAHREDGDTSVAAAVAYGIEVLGVRDVVVCGHSACGGAKALLGPPPADPHVRRWLQYARTSVDTWRAAGPFDDRRSAHDQLSQVNVVQQVANLETHGSVRAAKEKGALRLHAWWFDIGAGEVLAYSPETARFEPAIAELTRIAGANAGTRAA